MMGNFKILAKALPSTHPYFWPPTLPLPLGRVVMFLLTEKDDPTISWCHLMVELSVLVGWEKSLGGVVTTHHPSVDED